MQQVPPIDEVDKHTRRRAHDWYAFLLENGYELVVENTAMRSDTVIAVRAEKERIEFLKNAAYKEGITLGNGYGKEKDTSFRIANFPAISDEEIATLKAFLVKMAPN